MIVKWIPVEVTYFDDRESKVVKSVGKFVYQSFLIIIRTVRDARPMVFFGIPGVSAHHDGLVPSESPFLDIISPTSKSLPFGPGFHWLEFCF